MREEIKRRIELLREAMAERGMDAFLIPTADFHGSEYVNDHFKCREYLTGFTGSAGTAVITMEEAGLWTDGRYFVQARQELRGTGVTLFEMGREGVPGIPEYLEKKMPRGGVLGFDGRTVDGKIGEELERRLKKKGISLSVERDLAGELWENRPPLPAHPLWVLPEELAGQPAAEKIAGLRQAMEKRQATVHLLTSLDDIMWLLNIRGGDVPCLPVALCYLIVTRRDLLLFVNRESVDPETEKYLAENGVRLFPYGEVYETVRTFKYERVLLEKGRVNYRLLRSLDETVTVLDAMNPTAAAKAVKNPSERENLKKAHLKDGAALTRFLMNLKKRAAAGETLPDEFEAAALLDGLRAGQEGNLGPSFETISAYGPNAAMCHYHAEKESAAPLKPSGLYLVDSGGQYREGTTDVTRTVALGPLTREEKESCTLVAACMLRLLQVKFPSGCRGFNLDYAARELLWQRGLDFNHGTGHGVGFLGNVHERPCGIRWRIASPEQLDTENAVLQEGMVISNEPGLYREGRFGVRTENMMLCVKAEKNEFGQFLRFENLTWVPIDRDTIDPALLEPRDLELLNAYNREVYRKLAPYLDEEERGWLQEATREIS